MNTEILIAIASLIGVPMAIFTVRAFIDERIKLSNKEILLELKMVKAQIGQLQSRVGILQHGSEIENSGFLRDTGIEE